MEIFFIGENNKIDIKQIYNFLKPIKEHLYPDFDIWFSQKVLPDLQEGKRDICLAMDKDSILSVGIVKYADEEDDHKICTLFVPAEHGNKGYGSAIFKEMLHKIDLRPDRSKRIYLSFLESQKNIISFYSRFGFSLFSIQNGICYMEKR